MKRKRNTAATTAFTFPSLEEQIQSKRTLLTADLPSQIPKLREHIQQLELQLQNVRNLASINQFRQLTEQKQKLEHWIQQIENGHLALQFEQCVSSLSSTKTGPSAAPAAAENKNKQNKQQQEAPLGGEKQKQKKQASFFVCAKQKQKQQPQNPTSLKEEDDDDSEDESSSYDQEIDASVTGEELLDQGDDEFDTLSWVQRQQHSTHFERTSKTSTAATQVYCHAYSIVHPSFLSTTVAPLNMTPLKNMPQHDGLPCSASPTPTTSTAMNIDEDIQQLTASLMDYKLLTPQSTRKDVCDRCGILPVRSEEDCSLSCEECGFCKGYLDTTSQPGSFSSAALHASSSTSSCVAGGRTHSAGGTGGTKRTNNNKSVGRTTRVKTPGDSSDANQGGTNKRTGGNSLGSLQGRMNRLEALVSSFLESEYCEIPERIVRNIREELFKLSPAVTLRELSISKLKDLNKKLEIGKCNEVQLYTFLNNIPYPLLSEARRGPLVTLLSRICELFDSFKGKRRHFWNFHLVFAVACEWLGYTEFLPFLPLLKGTRQLSSQETTLRQIGASLGYVPVAPTALPMSELGKTSQKSTGAD